MRVDGFKRRTPVKPGIYKIAPPAARAKKWGRILLPDTQTCLIYRVRSNKINGICWLRRPKRSAPRRVERNVAVASLI